MVQGGKIGGHISPPSGQPKGKDLPVGKDGSHRYRVKAGMVFPCQAEWYRGYFRLCPAETVFYFENYNLKGYNHEVRFFRH